MICVKRKKGRRFFKEKNKRETFLYMKGIKKSFIFVIVFAVIMSLCSCSNGFFTEGNGTNNATSSKNESTVESIGRVNPSEINFNLKYVTANEMKPTTTTEVVAKVRPSVLELYCIVGTSKSSGSGVILAFDDSDGDGKDDQALVITCHHVIESASQMTAKSIYGKEYAAELIGSDPISDIALLWISIDENSDFTGLTAAEMMYDSDSLIIGADVLAIGNPLGYLGGTVTKGIISALNRDVTVENRKMTLIQTDAAINGGNSGGGLFDASTGALIGIVNAGYKSSSAQGLSFAIPCGTVKSIMDKLLDKGYVEGNFDFGVTFDASTFYNSAWSTKTYVVIDSLDAYGSFSKGGMEEGDIILSVKVGSKSIDVSDYSNATLTELDNFLKDSSFKIGDKVTVQYMRYSRTLRSYEKATAEFDIEQYIYGII